MEFKKLFRMLKKHLADGDGVPSFFRELMAMIATVSESEWAISKAPVQKLTGETIRTYTMKAKLPRKIAKKAGHLLTPEILTERINERSEETRASLTADLSGFDTEINQDNVAEKTVDMIVEIIHFSAGLAPENEIEEQVKRQMTVARRDRGTSRMGAYINRVD